MSKTHAAVGVSGSTKLVHKLCYYLTGKKKGEQACTSPDLKRLTFETYSKFTVFTYQLFLIMCLIYYTVKMISYVYFFVIINRDCMRM